MSGKGTPVPWIRTRMSGMGASPHQMTERDLVLVHVRLLNPEFFPSCRLPVDFSERVAESRASI